MNKIYKVVFNYTLQVYQAVSELSKAHGKKSSLPAERKNNCDSKLSNIQKLIFISLISGFMSFQVFADTTVPLSGITQVTNGEGINVSESSDDTTLIIGMDPNITADSLTIGNTKISAGGIAAGGEKITGVSAGDISSASSTDAVNGGQLFTTNQNVSTNTSDISSLKTRATADETNISTNTSDISGLKTRVTADETNISTNTSDISGLKTRATTDETNITNNANAITALQTTSAGIKYFRENSTGSDASATGTDAIAVGSSSISSGADAISEGISTTASGNASIALGKSANAASDNSIAIGVSAITDGTTGIAIGDGTKVSGAGGVALGTSASSDTGIALGISASTDSGIALGASASSGTGIALGISASTSNGIALGASAKADGDNSIALGGSASTSGLGDISLGLSAGLNSTGTSTANNQANRIALGTDAGQSVSGNEDISIGLNAGNSVSGSYNIAIGSSAGGSINGDDNVSIGWEANSKNIAGSHSTAVGASANASSGATAIGYLSNAAGQNSIAIGYSATSSTSSGIAIGVKAVSADDSSIALGNASYAISSDSSGTGYLTGTTAGVGVISVGSSGKNGFTFQRRITNVAAGSSAYDAVNVQQLQDAQTSVANLVGGSVSLNTSTGQYSGITIMEKQTNGEYAPVTYSTIANAITALVSNSITVDSAGYIAYSDSTDANVKLAGTGGTTISNVATALTSDEAVNLGQMNQAIADSSTKYFSVNSTAGGNSDNRGATGTNAVAIGGAVTAVGTESISLGYNTKAQGDDTIVLGNAASDTDRQTIAYNTSGVAIGTSASSTGSNSIAIGTYAQTGLQNSSTTTSNNSIAIGDYAEATADSAVAFGQTAHASGTDSIAQGYAASATNGSSIAVGTETTATGTSSTALGSYITVSAVNSGVIGSTMSGQEVGTTLNGSDTYAIGNGDSINSANSSIVGNASTVYSQNSSITGNGNSIGAVVKTDSTGINTTIISAQNSSVLGNSNTVTSIDSSIIGDSNTVGKPDTTYATSYDFAKESGVFGNSNTLTGSNDRIIGNSNTVNDLSDVFILGNGVTSGLGNSIYLGTGSAYVPAADSNNTTEGISTYSGAVIGNGTYTFAGASPVGVVTAGTTGSTRRIQNVSAGLVAASSTDAVNGSELYALTQPLRFAGDNSIVGNESTASSSDTNVIQRSSDQAISIVGGAQTNSLTTGNIGVIASTEADTLTVELAKDLTGLTSVTTGNTIMNTNGLSIAGGPSITTNGINANNQRITNVAQGTNSTDAVNVSQLNSTVSNSKTTVSAGKNVTVIRTGTGPIDYNVALDDSVTLGTAGSADAVALDGTKGTITAGTGTNAVAIDGTVGTVKTGNVTVTGGLTNTITGLSNTTWTGTTNDVSRAATEGELSEIVSEGLTFAGNTGSDAVALGKTVTIHGGNAGTKVSDTNLYTTENGGIIDIEMSTTPTFDSITAGTGASQVVIGSTGVSVGGNVYINSTGINANSQKITNVKTGEADTDAVNVGQLNSKVAASTTEVNNTDNNLVVTKSTDPATNAPEYTVNLSDDITLGVGADSVTIDGTKGTIVAGTGTNSVNIDGTDGTVKTGTVTVTGGSTNTITGLSNTTWSGTTNDVSRAATEGELYQATSGTNGGLYFDADNDTASSGAIHKTLGSTLDIIGGYTGIGTTSATNVKTVTTADGKIQVQLADNANFTSVTTGNTTMSTSGVTATDSSDNKTTVSSTGTTTTDGNGNTTVTSGTGVVTTDSNHNSTTLSSTGVTTTDKSGNSTTVSSTGLRTTDSSGNTTTVSGNGITIKGETSGNTVTIDSDNVNMGGNQIHNIAPGSAGTDAVDVDQLNSKVAGATTTVKAGDSNVKVTGVQQADGHMDYAVSLEPSITLGTTAADEVTINGNAGTITAGTGDNAVNINGTNGTISAGTKVSLDGVNGKATVGNVTINGGGSTGTVNGLTNTTWNVNSITSGQAATEDQLKVVDKETIHYDTNSDGTVNYNKVTMGGGTSGTTITNVAAGTVSSTSTDAVNGSQLYGVEQTVINQGNAINNIGNEINSLGNRVNEVGANAAALAALHPLDFDPDDKWDFAAGYGHYRSANAASVGAFYRPNEDTMFSIGASTGGGDNMFNAGVTFKLGQGNHISTSRVAMAKQMNDMQAVMEKQAKQIQKLTALVSTLTGMQALKTDSTEMFPDVPENHWAYKTIKAMATQGLIEGYPDGTFGGDRTMTRYEFAQIIYRVLQKGIAVDSKLVSEFKPELERIRVDTISKDKNGNPVIERVRVNEV